MTTDEETLVLKVAAGDESAFATLTSRHLPAVSAYVMRMMAGHADAEDVIQETFLRFWTRASQFDGRKSRLTTWLHNIAHNLTIDYFRRSGRFVGEDAGDPAPTSGPDVEQERLEAAAEIDRMMMSLPERQRSALIMTHYQGLSNRDVAEVLGISVRALESLLARARGKLRESMKT